MSQGEAKAREDALPVAERVVEWLRPGCERIEIAGSLRRGRPIVHDIELVAIAQVVDRPDGMFNTARVDVLDERIAGLMANGYLAPRLVENHRGDGSVDVQHKLGPAFKALVTAEGIEVDLFIVRPPATWGCIFALRTGPGTWNTRLVMECKAITSSRPTARRPPRRWRSAARW